MREMGAVWDYGLEFGFKIVKDTDINIIDDVFFYHKSGKVLLTSENVIEKFNMQNGDFIIIPNDFDKSYITINKLNQIKLDSTGKELNRYFSFVIYGVISKPFGQKYVLLNLPSGSYDNIKDLLIDRNNYTCFDIDEPIRLSSFYLTKVDIEFMNNQYTIHRIEDLRGKWI